MAASYAYTVGDNAARIRALQRTLNDDPLNKTKQRVDFVMSASRGEFDTNHPYYKRIVSEFEICIADNTCKLQKLGNTLEVLGNAVLHA